MMNTEQIRLAEQYTRETQARQQVVRQYSWYGDPRWRCSVCKQHPNVCTCGTTPARDEEPTKRPVFGWDDRGITTDAPPPTPPKEETWRDRPPLL